MPQKIRVFLSKIDKNINSLYRRICTEQIISQLKSYYRLNHNPYKGGYEIP